MEENNELFNENEFLNILNEPESTLPDDIILGAGCKKEECTSNCDDTPCDDDCTEDSGGICKADACSSQGTKGSTGDTGDNTGETTYYYALQIKANKKGYYMPNQLPNGTYQLVADNPVGFWFHSVSGANSTVRSILTNGYTTNTGYSITTASTCVFAASGTTNVAFGDTATTTGTVVGYVFLSASATNRRFSNTTAYPLAVYARFWPNSQYSSFVTAYTRIATGQTTLGHAQDYYMKEKTFSIYTKYNNLPVQGSIVTITNVGTYFPQYESQTGNKILTGYDGGVILSTSSVTGTTISGFVDRIGFNGNSHVNFTATADTICTVNLSHTSNLERYELPLYDMVKTNILLDPLVDIYYDGGIIQEIGPSLTTKMLNSHGFSAETSPATTQLQFIRAYDLIRTKPALSYNTNDPVLGKFAEISYTISSDITITTALTQVTTFAWDMANVYQFNYPTITKTGTTSTVEVQFYATTVANGITYSNVLLKTVPCSQATMSVSQTLNFDTLTNQHGAGANGSMSVRLYVRKTTNVGTLKLKSGTYNYSYTGGGGGNIPAS